MEKKIIINFALLLTLITVLSCKKDCIKPDPIDTTGITKNFKPEGSFGKDANIVNNSGVGPISNYGSKEYLITDAWTNSGNQYYRTLIQFDLSSLSKTAKINNAILVLYADTTTLIYGGATKSNNGHSQLTGENSWTIKKITTAWDENSVTWNTQPTVDESSKMNIPASTSRSQKYEIDITSFIKDAVADQDNNHGFMFFINNENYYRSIIFCSSDHQYSTLHPELKINYTE